MVMIINVWMLTSPAAEVALKGVARIAPRLSAEPPPPTPVIPSVQFPHSNHLDESTLGMLRFNQLGLTQLFPPGLWSSYARGEGLHSFVTMREDLQGLETLYAPDIIVAGAWDIATGEPLGGVGSPWFVTPPELTSYMPDGKLQDLALIAGQKSRKFV